MASTFFSKLISQFKASSAQGRRGGEAGARRSDMKTRASNTERAQFKLEFKRGTAPSKFPNLEIKATWRELNTIWRD